MKRTELITSTSAILSKSSRRSTITKPPSAEDDADGGLDMYIQIRKIDDSTPNRIRAKCLRRLEMRPDYPLIFSIDTYGGDAYALLSILDFWEELKNKHDITIVTVCTGKAFSAGAFLLAAGSVRYATPHSTIMLHELLGGASYGNVRDVLTDSEELKRLNTVCMGLLSKYTGIKQEELQQMFSQKRDVYLNATQAKAKKIIDRIGYPEIKVETKYDFS